LSGSDRQIDEQILPFRKHWPNHSWNQNWSLYWLPASFNNRRDSRADPRFLDLFERFIMLFAKEDGLRPYTFFDSQLIHPHLTEHFVLHAMDYLPLGAIGYFPGSEPTRFPNYDDATQIDAGAMYQKLKEKQQDFNMHDVFPNAPKSLQFIVGDHDMARRELMGRGGYSFALSKMSHAEFSAVTKQRMMENTQDPIMMEIPMVIPILSASSFTMAPVEHVAAWFKLLEFYVAESPVDKGILVASNRCLDEELAEYVKAVGLSQAVPRRFWSLSR
jgi:hypothetical protein